MQGLPRSSETLRFAEELLARTPRASAAPNDNQERERQAAVVVRLLCPQHEMLHDPSGSAHQMAHQRGWSGSLSSALHAGIWLSDPAHTLRFVLSRMFIKIGKVAAFSQQLRRLILYLDLYSWHSHVGMLRLQDKRALHAPGAPERELCAAER